MAIDNRDLGYMAVGGLGGGALAYLLSRLTGNKSKAGNALVALLGAAAGAGGAYAARDKLNGLFSKGKDAVADATDAVRDTANSAVSSVKDAVSPKKSGLFSRGKREAAYAGISAGAGVYGYKTTPPREHTVLGYATYNDSGLPTSDVTRGLDTVNVTKAFEDLRRSARKRDELVQKIIYLNRTPPVPRAMGLDGKPIPGTSTKERLKDLATRLHAEEAKDVRLINIGGKPRFIKLTGGGWSKDQGVVTLEGERLYITPSSVKKIPPTTEAKALRGLGSAGLTYGGLELLDFLGRLMARKANRAATD